MEDVGEESMQSVVFCARPSLATMYRRTSVRSGPLEGQARFFCRAPLSPHAQPLPSVLSKHKPLDAVRGMGVAKHDTEGRVLTLEFPTFFLVATYVPNSGRGGPRADGLPGKCAYPSFPSFSPSTAWTSASTSTPTFTPT